MAHKNDRPIILVKIEQESETDHPLALVYLVNALRKAGYNSRILLERSQNFDVDTFVSKILDADPLYVGFSSITGRQTYDSAIVCQKLKQRAPGLITVWGGIHTSLVPEQTLHQPYVDFIVKQEGEETIVEFTEAILSGTRDFSAILGLGYKRDGKEIINRDRPFINLPDYELEEADWEHIDVEKSIYTDPTTGSRTITLQTSRGCPFNCGFCYSARFTKRRMRYYAPEQVERMGQILNEKYGVTAVLFTDDNIYFNYSRMHDIVIRLKNVGIASGYLQTRVEDITEESLQNLAKLGVSRVFFGIETGSLSTKILISKKISNELIKEKFRIISKYPEMGITCALIVGFPTEVESSIDETIRLGVELSEIHPNTVVTLQTYVPFPGTDLYQLAIGGGYQPPQNPLEYRDLDSFDGDIDIKWASYKGLQGKDLALKLNLMNKYASLLTHNRGTTPLRTLGKKLLAHFARFRLKNDFYFYPFELSLLARYNRYIQHLYKDKGGAENFIKNRYLQKAKSPVKA